MRLLEIPSLYTKPAASPRRLCRATIALAACGLLAACGPEASRALGDDEWQRVDKQAEQHDPGYERLDLLNGKLVPITPAEMNIGQIYRYYDRTVGRRVWAIWEGNGFSITLDPGSAQPARAFGYTSTSQEAINVLRQRDPKLAEEVSREGTEVFLRLQSDQAWRLTRTKVPFIYNAASGQRWELQFDKYIPIGHLGGFSWQPSGRGYAAVMPASEDMSDDGAWCVD